MKNLTFYSFCQILLLSNGYAFIFFFVRRRKKIYPAISLFMNHAKVIPTKHPINEGDKKVFFNFGGNYAVLKTTNYVDIRKRLAGNPRCKLWVNRTLSHRPTNRDF